MTTRHNTARPNTAIRRLTVVSAALGVALAAAPGALTADAKDTFALKGEVYPTAFKIEMKNAANRKLTSVKAGTYRIKVEDPSSIHNFRLKGPGVNKATTVAGKSERIWTLALKKGTYTYVCDPHAGAMKGTFRVT